MQLNWEATGDDKNTPESMSDGLPLPHPMVLYCPVVNIWIVFSHVVQLLSRVWLSVTPWIAARQASLSLTTSQSLPKLMLIASLVAQMVKHQPAVRETWFDP